MMTSKPFIFSLKHFKLAIIDESSQILEPNLIGLLSAVDKFILIGDYKQLPAVVQQSEQDSGIPTINDSQKGGVIDMSILQDICLTNCRNSLFERLIHWEDHEERSEFIGILRRQGRMHPEIAEFPTGCSTVGRNWNPCHVHTSWRRSCHILSHQKMRSTTC